MDFDELFQKYKLEAEEENKNKSVRKIYKELLKGIKVLLKATQNSIIDALASQTTLENDLFLKKENLEPNEPPYYILLSTGKKKPFGYGKLIQIHQRKEADMYQFQKLFALLKHTIVNDYTTKPTFIEHLNFYSALLEVMSDTLAFQIEEYETLIKEAEHTLEKEEIPILRNVSVCASLQEFFDTVQFYEFYSEKLDR